jgi:hypothetical protein
LIYTDVEDKGSLHLKWLYSGLYFAVTFIVLNYSSHAWSTSHAWDHGYRPLFSYAGMDNLQHTSGWTVSKIAWVFLAPPVWGLGVSLLSLGAFRSVDSLRTNLRTILFWFSVNGFLLFYSYLTTGLMSWANWTSKFFMGFVGFFAWLDWTKGTIIGVTAVFSILALAYSFIFSKPVMQLNYSRLLASRPNGKSIVFLNVVFIPYIIGCALVAIASFPMDLGYQAVRMVSYLPVFVFCMLGISFFKSKYITVVRGGLKHGSTWLWVVLAVSLVLITRLVLSVKIGPLW